MAPNVLVVEDDRITAVDLVDTLEDHGMAVHGVVHRGEDVHRAVEERMPDIVLMDVHLEGALDGVETARRLMETFEGLPIVFLTAQADAVTVRRMHEVGAAGVLTKPFSDEELPRVLRSALEHARARSAILARGDRLWVTLQAIADAVVTVDRYGRVEHLNPAAERLSGWSVEEAAGTLVEEVLDLRAGRGGQRLPNPARLALKEGETQSLGPDAWLHPRGAPPRHVGDTAAPIRDEDGSLLGAVLVLQDLTEREQLQNLLARADRLASMGTMAAGIAHEINNPLTYIIHNVEALLEELAEVPDVDASSIEALQDVNLGARAIERIVGDLKLLTTPDQRSQEAVDVAQVLRRSQRMAAKTVRARGRFEASLQPTAPLYANPVALGQVVTNLVLNAAQAFPERYDEAHVVRLSCRDDGEQIVIEVADNGPGIPPEIRDRIFDPFFTTKAVGKGTGLGLAICHQIVSDLGGRIDVESELGAGTTVRVILPAITSTPDDEAEHDSLWPTGEIPSRRVLVIDDDDKVRRALISVLRRAHAVHAVASVDAAAAHLAQGFGYDAILCDLMMSPRSGLELLPELQRVAPDLVFRTAFITGGVFAGSLQERVIEAGRPVAYKPFSPDELFRLVEELAAS